MYVGFENMRDRHPIFARHGDVNVAIRPGVENSGDPFLIIPDQVREFRDAGRLDGFENERHRVI